MDLLNQGSFAVQSSASGIPGSGAFADCLRTRAKEFPEKTAYLYVDADGVVSEIRNRELWDRVRRVARCLESNEIQGNSAILSYPPGFDFVVGFFATVIAGAIAIPVPVLRRKDRHARHISIVRDSGAKWLLSSSDQIERMQSQRILGNGIECIATDCLSQDDEAQVWQPPVVGPENLAVVQYTSGSTSSPKGVMLTHRNLVHNCEMIVQAMGIRRGDVGLSWLPPYHDMGLIGGILAPLLTGSSTVLISPATFLRDPLVWLRLVSDHKVTISGGPDFGFRHCVERIPEDEFNGIDLSCWRAAYVGAEPVHADTLRRFAKKFESVGFKFETFFPCYGLAEATLIVTGGPLGSPKIGKFKKSALGQNIAVPVSNEAEDATELVASGEVMPNESVKIVSPETFREVKDGSIGEIWVDSPGVAEGYLKNPGATEETFGAKIKGSGVENTFLRTGDLGFFHHGQLFVTGRLKDLIIIRGVNHYPQDIEYTCESASSSLRKSAIVAFSTEVDNQERLVVVAEAERSASPDWKTKIARIRNFLAAEHDLRPVEIQIVSAASLPKTPSGKLRRNECRILFEENSLKVIAFWKDDDKVAADPASASEPPSRESVAAFLNSLINHESPDTSAFRLADLGIDSVERLNLIHAIEQEFSIRISENDIRDLETISNIVDETLRRSNRSPSELGAGLAVDLSQTGNGVPTSHFKIEDFPEVFELKRVRSLLSDAGERDPYFAIHEGIARDKTEIEGREVINFASYNYLGLSGRPEVSEAAVRAVERFGTSSGASRLISGNREIHESLETSLADFVGTEAALTFVSGHSTNETVIGHLFGPEDLILYDSLAHNSITQGAKLSGAHRRSFAHNDHEALEKILSETRAGYRRVLIVTEGLFGIDGDVPELEKFVEIKNRHHCLLMVDEAHSLGTLGKTGKGICEHCGITTGEIDLIMGTLSKALASCGGFIAGRKELIEYLRYSAPGFVFSVGMPPASAAAAHAALGIIRREPELVADLQERSRYFLEKAGRENIETTSRLSTPIFSLELESPRKALDVSRFLLEQGVNAPPILYPAVSENSAKIRFFTCSTHTEEQIDFAIESLARIL